MLYLHAKHMRIIMNITKEEMINLYKNNNKTIPEIASIYDISLSDVTNLMKKYNIKYKKINMLTNLTKEDLEYLNHDKKLTKKEIANLYQSSVKSVSELIKKFSINYIYHTITSKKISKNDIIELNHNQKMNKKNMMEILKITYPALDNLFETYNVKYIEPPLVVPSIEYNELLKLNRQDNLNKKEIAELKSITEDRVTHSFKFHKIKYIRPKNKTKKSPVNEISILKNLKNYEIRDICHLYEKEKKSINYINNKYNQLTVQLIRKILLENNIVISKTKTSSITKENLYDLYISQKMTVHMIAEKTSFSPITISRKLKFFNIPSRLPARVNISKDELFELVYIKNLTLEEIGKLKNCCPITISQKLKKYNITYGQVLNEEERHERHSNWIKKWHNK